MHLLQCFAANPLILIEVPGYAASTSMMCYTQGTQQNPGPVIQKGASETFH